MCAKRCQSALNEKSTCYGLCVKICDTQLLIGRIIFLTREKSDMHHLIGLHLLTPVCEQKFTFWHIFMYIINSIQGDGYWFENDSPIYNMLILQDFMYHQKLKSI